MRAVSSKVAVAALAAVLLTSPALADPGGNGNGNGNAFGFGFGNGNGNGNGNGKGGPLPLLGASLLGQLTLAAGAYAVWRRRRSPR